MRWRINRYRPNFARLTALILPAADNTAQLAAGKSNGTNDVLEHITATVVSREK